MPLNQVLPLLLWMTGALLSFSVMAVSLRTLTQQFSVFEALAMRTAISVLILFAIACSRPGMFRQLAPHRMLVNLLRNGIHFSAMCGWTLGLEVLPLASVFALEFTTPAWTSVLAALLLGERLTPARLGAVTLGFIGVLVVARPGTANFHPAMLLVLAAAVGYALANIATKSLTATQTPFAIVFWMNVMQLPMALAGSHWPAFATIGSHQILPLIGAGISGLSAHFCLSNAFRLADASIVAPLDFLRLPLIAFVGWQFYGEPLDVYVFIGALLILAGIIWNFRADPNKTLREVEAEGQSGAP
jgi:drug/metabolite transporter (DMT)-like permease